MWQRWCERNRMDKREYIWKHHQDKVGGSRLEKEDGTEWGKDPVRKSSYFWAFKWSYDVCRTSRKSQAFLWLLELWVVCFFFFVSVVQIFYNVHAFCTKKKIHSFKNIIFQPFKRIMPQRMLCQLKYFDDLREHKIILPPKGHSWLEADSTVRCKFGNESWSLRGREMAPHGVEGAGS